MIKREIDTKQKTMCTDDSRIETNNVNSQDLEDKPRKLLDEIVKRIEKKKNKISRTELTLRQ